MVSARVTSVMARTVRLIVTGVYRGAHLARGCFEDVDTLALARQLIEPVPANSLFGIAVQAVEPGTATVGLAVTPQAGNVIGALHASGLIALVDAAGLAAMISLATTEAQLDGFSPLGSDADLTFFAPARGALRAHCQLDEAALEAMTAYLSGTADRAALLTLTEITDAADAVVCTGRFRWRVRRRVPNPVG